MKGQPHDSAIQPSCDDNPRPVGQAAAPSVEAAAVAQAITVAEAMLNDETDADPLAIKSRANAAIHLCDERDWQEAKREFAYAAICCEYRLVQDNPKADHGGDRKSSTAPVLDPSPLSPTTRRRMEEAYEGATADDVRAAKETADAEGETVRRGHVRQQVEAPADGVQRRAKASAQRAKAKREAAMDDKHALMQETLEGTAARAHAAEAELAARNAEDDDARGDAEAEMAAANANLVQMTEIQTKQIAELREKLTTAEGQVAYWKTYATEIEAALQRGDA